MKIGIIYDDVDREGLDCSCPQLGNPGVGGTQYCCLILLHYYVQKFPKDQLIVYRYCACKHIAKMPAEDKIIYKGCSSLEDCVLQASKDNVDMLLFMHAHIPLLSPLLVKYKIKGIVWVHNWIRGDVLKTISDNPFISKVVFLVNEHYDRYIDHPLITKGVIIPNMFNVKGYPAREENIHNFNVTYVGALVQGKGFDELAKAWTEVLKKVPDAQLYVIGKGNLYKEGVAYGKLGIAQKDFEDKFSRYITDSEGKVLPSVHFMGLMGAEKIDIYKGTKVGVVNPTGKTEVCPISALEMQAAKIPVVSANTNGIPDVIENKETGFLVSSSRQIAQMISSLLVDDNRNLEMGEKARNFVAKKFAPEDIILLWNKMFSNVCDNVAEKVTVHYNNLGNNYKWIRIINFYFKKVPLFRKFPAIIDLEAKASKIIRGK